MGRISIRVLDENKIRKISSDLGVSLSELYQEALFYFLTNHKHELSKRMRLKFLDRQERRRQKQLFFFKNEIQRLFRQAEWQYRVYGYVSHDIMTQSVKNALERFGCLDEDIKKLLEKQRKHYLEYLDQKQFDSRFENLAPKMTGEKWTRTKQLK